MAPTACFTRRTMEIQCWPAQFALVLKHSVHPFSALSVVPKPSACESRGFSMTQGSSWAASVSSSILLFLLFLADRDAPSASKTLLRRHDEQRPSLTLTSHMHIRHLPMLTLAWSGSCQTIVLVQPVPPARASPNQQVPPFGDLCVQISPGILFELHRLVDHRGKTSAIAPHS